jgi:hypothetical protein
MTSEVRRETETDSFLGVVESSDQFKLFDSRSEEPLASTQPPASSKILPLIHAAPCNGGTIFHRHIIKQFQPQNFDV